MGKDITHTLSQFHLIHTVSVRPEFGNLGIGNMGIGNWELQYMKGGNTCLWIVMLLRSAPDPGTVPPIPVQHPPYYRTNFRVSTPSVQCRCRFERQ